MSFAKGMIWKNYILTVSSMSRKKRRNILLIVEGEKAEVKLFTKIAECFPQMGYSRENIIVYKTNLWVLSGELKKYFGSDWYKQREIDMLGFIRSCEKFKDQAVKLEGKRITDIYLVFDYERQDIRFNAGDIENMQNFFCESTRNGMLYINYPMVEAYKHLKKPLPDEDFIDRACKCSELSEYKEIVDSESGQNDLRRLNTEDFKKLVIHNLCKAACMTGEDASRQLKCISEEAAYKYHIRCDLFCILKKQLGCSASTETGFVYVLATCLFFIPDYNPELIFDNETIGKVKAEMI